MTDRNNPPARTVTGPDRFNAAVVCNARKGGGCIRSDMSFVFSTYQSYARSFGGLNTFFFSLCICFWHTHDEALLFRGPFTSGILLFVV